MGAQDTDSIVIDNLCKSRVWDCELRFSLRKGNKQ